MAEGPVGFSQPNKKGVTGVKARTAAELALSELMGRRVLKFILQNEGNFQNEK